MWSYFVSYTIEYRDDEGLRSDVIRFSDPIDGSSIGLTEVRKSVALLEWCDESQIRIVALSLVEMPVPRFSCACDVSR